MKRFLLVLIAAIVLIPQGFTQDTTSIKVLNKKGNIVLPEKGDWCLGTNASPYLNYLGNLIKLSTSNNTAPSFGFTAQNPGFICGKYMLSETKAIRGSVIIGLSSNVSNDPDPTNPTKTTSYTTSALTFGIFLGIEKYRPLKNRLLGYYGYEFGFSVLPYNGRMRNSMTYITGSMNYENPQNTSANYVEKGGNTVNFIGKGFVAERWHGAGGYFA